MRLVRCRMCDKEFSTKSHRAVFCSGLCGDRFRSQRPPRTLLCKWCKKEFVKCFKKGWDKQKFCSVMCREEYHSFNNPESPFFKTNKTKSDVIEDEKKFVVCKICGQLARRRLGTHIKKKHGLSWKEYLVQYPNSEGECKELKMYAYEHRKIRKTEETLSGNDSWDVVIRIKKEKVGDKCELCGFDKYPEAIVGHHILPISLGGKNEISNCAIVCENCHSHLHRLIRQVIFRQKKYTIEDIVRTYSERVRSKQ